MLNLSFSTMLPPDPLARQYSTLHMHWLIVTNTSKLPQTQKNRKKMTDAPDTDDPDSAGGDAADAPNSNENYYVLIDSKNPNIRW